MSRPLDGKTALVTGFGSGLGRSHAVAWLAGPETDIMSGQVVSPNAGEVIVGY